MSASGLSGTPFYRFPDLVMRGKRGEENSFLFLFTNNWSNISSEVIHEYCDEGRMLLAAYLEAASRRGALRSSTLDPRAGADIEIAPEMLPACRELYWNHVHDHGCREA